MQIRSNSELFSNAWKELDGQWGITIGFFLVAAILSAVAGQILLTFVIGGALSVGQSIFYLNVSRRNNPQIEDLFKGFNSFVTSFLAFWLMGIIIFGGMLLLIVPGIYWAFCYAMTYWIIADNLDIKAFDALSKSKEIMNGHKWKLFRFGLRAFFWIILGCIPLGLGLLIVMPWISVATAKFYEDISQE